LKRRRVDREKFDRADRECRLVLEAERHAREAKTARLREQRLNGKHAREHNPAAEIKPR